MIKFVCFFICVISFNKVHALSEAEITVFREVMKPIVSECGAKHGVTPAQLKEAQANTDVNRVDPCFIGCIFKKLNIIDSEGIFQLEQAITVLTSNTKDAGNIAKFKEISTKCASVNDVPVTDGAAGCQRAKLAIVCSLENNFDRSLFQAVGF